MWFYSTEDRLIYNAANLFDSSELQKKLQEKIPDCKLWISAFTKKSYTGMPYNADYGLCLRLESKNCNVQNVWCETVETNILKEVYEIMKNSASDFIRN